MNSRLTILPILVIFISLIGVATAQIPGGMDTTTRTDMGGRNYIVGTVFGPNGLPINARIRIRLASLTSREVITTTDEYGKFIFSGLGPGSYTVNIDDDKDYHSMVQMVDIQNPKNAPAESYTLSFRLVPKAGSPGKATVIDSDKTDIPQKALDHYDEAIKRSRAGDTQGAIAELKDAIEKYPEFMLALTELGVQQLKIGDLAAADESFAAALKIRPNAYEPTINRGIGLFRQKHYLDAENYLRSALKIKATSTVAHYYLGRTLMAENNLDEAESELNVAVTSKEPLVEVHRMLTQLYIQKGDYVKARQQLEIYLAANPTPPDNEQLRTVLKQLQDATATTEAPQKP
jgi:tetratricopeptide (TPR) repeat protein